jgi:hypothetical protein
LAGLVLQAIQAAQPTEASEWLEEGSTTVGSVEEDSTTRASAAVHQGQETAEAPPRATGALEVVAPAEPIEVAEPIEAV